MVCQSNFLQKRNKIKFTELNKINNFHEILIEKVFFSVSKLDGSVNKMGKHFLELYVKYDRTTKRKIIFNGVFHEFCAKIIADKENNEYLCKFV